MPNVVLPKKWFFCSALAAAAVLFWGMALADSGPVIMNANPQGTVTNSNVKITLDTQDLARCKYSKSDTSYGNMGDTMESPDGLYHTAALGTLNRGSYTYYVRCQSFEGIANDSSTTVKFTVGEVTCVGDSCGGSGDTAGPALSGFLPSGTTYNSYVTLAVNTSEAADCRYSWYDKSFDSMTLVFSTSNRTYHTAQAALSNYGYYTYYVRCRDTAGNVNAAAGKISFRYASNTPVTPPVTKPVTPADTTPPVISNPVPSGDIDTAAVTLAVATNEAATCKYGTTDAEYDKLTDTMDAGTGQTTHSKSVTLTNAGAYTYYVRCKDAAGNKDIVSTPITFNYAAAKKEGPVISNLQPTGAIYQRNVALIVSTDKPAECRYSKTDGDFDTMLDAFSTNDGLLQQATVVLDDYGPYAYYVRCRDKEGNKDARSEVINFEYRNPDQETGTGATEPETKPEEKTVQTPVSCAETNVGDKDGVCDNTPDCICDPDCPASGDDADSDCANVTTAAQSNNSWIVIVLIGLLLVIVVIIIIVMMKRRNGGEEEVELP